MVTLKKTSISARGMEAFSVSKILCSPRMQVCGARISPLNDHIIELFVRFPRIVVRVRHVFDLLGYFPDFHVL